MLNQETTERAPTTDIAILSREALDAATQPDTIREIVEERIAKTVKDAIDSATRSYSKFGRELEKKIEEALSIQTLDLPSYNTMICGMVEQSVKQHTADLIQGRLKEDLEALLSIAPKTIKLSEIVARMIEERHSDEGYGEVVTCHVDHIKDGDDFWGPSWKIYLDDYNVYDWHERKSAEVCLEIRHGIKQAGEDGEKPDNNDIFTGTIDTVSAHGRDLASSQHTFSTTKHNTRFVSRFLAYYAAETIIEIDEDEVITSVGDY